MRRRGTATLVLGAALAWNIVQPPALQADDLTELLGQVGEEYAEAYVSPIINAHGVNQNAGIYHTADLAGTGFHLTIGLKVMATQIAAEDQYFRKVIEDVPVGDLLPDDPMYDPWRGETGDVVMEGPTAFGPSGDADAGRSTIYVDGIPVYAIDTIPGLVDTRWVPLFAPQATIGRFYGLSGTIRFLPEIDLSSYGKTKYFGWGLSWGVNTVLPELPLDLAVGYFTQEIDAGDVLQTDAESFYLAASKRFSLVTLYGGYAREKSSMAVDYWYEGYEDGAITVEPYEVSFDVDGIQKNRFTVGVTLHIGVKLNAEYSHGKLNTFTAGLLFGS